MQVSRDPFARTELHRETVPDTKQRECDFCGMPRTIRRSAGGVSQEQRTLRQNLFRYCTESDGGRRSEHKGLFCSKQCHDSYHS